MDAAAFGYRCEAKFDFPSEALADKACKVLEVDPTLNADTGRRLFSSNGKQLCVTIEATDAKLLRAITNTTIDMLKVVVSTMREFPEL